MVNPVQCNNNALPLSIDLPITVSKTQTLTTVALNTPVFCTTEAPLAGNLPTGAGRILYYSTIAGVISDWGTAGEAYKAATAFFSQSPRASTLAIAQIFTTAQAGYLLTGIVGTVNAFSLVSDGSFNITIDGVNNDIDSLDFSLVTDYDDIAAVIEAGIQAIGTGGFTAATVVASAPTGTDVQFTITSGTTGDGSSVSVLAPAATGTDISGATYLNGTNGTTVLGYTPTGLANELQLVSEAASCSGQFVYAYVSDANYWDTSDQLAAAAWAETQTFAKYVTKSENPLSLDSGNTSNNIYSLNQSGLSHTIIFYSDSALSDQYEDMSFIAKMLSVDYNAENSIRDGKFQDLIGLQPTAISETELSVLESRRGNVFTVIGNGARTTREGVTCSDSWYVDDAIGIDNFVNDLMTEVYNVFLRNPRVPYTSAGQALIYNAEKTVCDKYVRNGLFADRVVTDTTEPSGVRTIPAYDIAFTPLNLVTQSDRDARLMTGNVITVQLAGSIHKLQINVIVEE